MTVELISVSDSLLLGNSVNKNAAILAAECADLGMQMDYQCVVKADLDHLVKAYQKALEEADVVIIVGGLDKEEGGLAFRAAERVLGNKLSLDAKADNCADGVSLENMPYDVILLHSEEYNSCGYIIEENQKLTILLPNESDALESIFTNHVTSYFEKTTDDVVYTNVIKTYGCDEKQLNKLLSDILATQSNPTISIFTKANLGEIRIVGCGQSRESARNLVKSVTKEIKKRLGTAIYSANRDDYLEDAVFKLLKKYDLKIATAESCTGGLIGAKLVNVSGISEYYTHGFITYSNKAKRKLLNVNRDVLKKYSAVSKEVAREMVKGCLQESGADVALSVTGYAGPYDSKEEPKGLVYIGCAVGNHITVEEFHFEGNRQEIRESASMQALNMARLLILEKYDH